MSEYEDKMAEAGKTFSGIPGGLFKIEPTSRGPSAMLIDKIDQGLEATTRAGSRRCQVRPRRQQADAADVSDGAAATAIRRGAGRVGRSCGSSTSRAARRPRPSTAGLRSHGVKALAALLAAGDALLLRHRPGNADNARQANQLRNAQALARVAVQGGEVVARSCRP
jgi:type IV secretory pathway TrbL component